MMKEPEKILKMNSGKYQVKWRGFEEPTWEPEENMKKFKDLIEDFRYFSLTGDRYSEQQLEGIRQQQQQSLPRTAVKRVSAGIVKPLTFESKRDKKVEKTDSKQGEILDNQSNEINTPNVITNLKNDLTQNNHYTPTNALVAIHKQVQNTKHQNVLLQKQVELAEKLNQNFPILEDEPETIKVIVTEDDCIFEVSWKERSNGIAPLPQRYEYDTFKYVAPFYYFSFIENCILECNHESNTIKFEAPGNTAEETLILIMTVLNKKAEKARKDKTNHQEVIV